MRSPSWVGLALGLITLISSPLPPVAAQNSPPANSKADRASDPTEEADNSLPEGVVARFSGGQISAAELERRLAAMPEAMRTEYAKPDKLRELYDETLRYHLLVAEAKRRGYAERAPAKNAARQNAVQALIRSAVDEQITPEGIAMAEVQAYYDAHKREYNRPELRRISHIQVGSREEAEALLKQLASADLRTFRSTAQRTSSDENTKLRGGDLRFFDDQGNPPAGTEGLPPAPELVKAAFDIAHLGELYPRPVPHSGHFSVVKLTGRREAERRTAKEAASAIRSRLVHERRQAALDAIVVQLKEQQKPDIKAERITWVLLETADPHQPRGPGVPPGFPKEPPVQVVPPTTEPAQK